MRLLHKSLFLPLLVLATLSSRAQALYFQKNYTNWEYNYHRVDSGFRPPLDTLPRAELGSIANLNGRLYTKQLYKWVPVASLDAGSVAGGITATDTARWNNAVGSGVNIYNSNGTLLSDRILDGGSYNLIFQNLGQFYMPEAGGGYTRLSSFEKTLNLSFQAGNQETDQASISLHDAFSSHPAISLSTNQDNVTTGHRDSYLNLDLGKAVLATSNSYSGIPSQTTLTQTDSGFVFDQPFPVGTPLNIKFLNLPTSNSTDGLTYHTLVIDQYGRMKQAVGSGVSSINFTTPSVIFSSPVSFSNANGDWTGGLSLLSQNPYTLFGRSAGTGQPLFLNSIDSNWVTGLHSKGYYDALYGTLTRQQVNTSSIGALSALTTTVKTDLVSALNEVNGKTITSLNLNGPGVIFTTPTTFTGSNGVWTGTMTLNTQSAYSVFGNLTSSSTSPTFGKLPIQAINATGSTYDGTRYLKDNGTWGTISFSELDPYSVLNKPYTGSTQTASFNISDSGYVGKYLSVPNFRLTGITSDPSGLNGMLEYNTTAAQFHGYRAGAWVNMLAGNDAILNQNTSMQTASLWISGTAKFQNDVTIYSSGSSGNLYIGNSFTGGTVLTLTGSTAGASLTSLGTFAIKVSGVSGSPVQVFQTTGNVGLNMNYDNGYKLAINGDISVYSLNGMPAPQGVSDTRANDLIIRGGIGVGTGVGGSIIFQTAPASATSGGLSNTAVQRMAIDAATGNVTVNTLNDATGVAKMVTTTNGVLSYQAIPTGGSGGSYTLPAATASALGGVKIGNNINVTADGTISTPYSYSSMSAVSSTDVRFVRPNGTADTLSILLPNKTPQVFTDGITITIDGSLGYNWNGTIAGNRTFAFTNVQAGDYIKLNITQDVTGSRTVTWPASVKWKSGTAPTLTTTAGATDIVILYYNGSNYFGVYGNDFK